MNTLTAALRNYRIQSSLVTDDLEFAAEHIKNAMESLQNTRRDTTTPRNIQRGIRYAFRDLEAAQKTVKAALEATK